jgi:putative ABC transport system permease protein
VTVVAAVGILVGLYNTIHARRREIAVLRALGARPRQVFAWILLEALLLCTLGGLLGVLLGHGAVAAAAPALLESYGVVADVAPGIRDLEVLAVLAGLGILAGLLPAWRGLRTPVATNLQADG